MKVIVKNESTYTSAIKDEAFYEYLKEKYKINVETMIVDSRDHESIVRAMADFDIIIPDNGIFVLIKIESLDELADVLKKENLGMDINTNPIHKTNSKEVI